MGGVVFGRLYFSESYVITNAMHEKRVCYIVPRGCYIWAGSYVFPCPKKASPGYIKGSPAGHILAGMDEGIRYPGGGYRKKFRDDTK